MQRNTKQKKSASCFGHLINPPIYVNIALKNSHPLLTLNICDKKMSYHTLLASLQAPFSQPSINPEKLNAEQEVMEELNHTVPKFANRHQISHYYRFGLSFVAGADISEFNGLSK
jgi:hypothetical protein